MKAWQVTGVGEPDQVLRRVDIPEVTAAPGQLVVRVLANALGFPDVLMCRGEYQVRPDPPFVPGSELCGEIVHIDPAISATTGLAACDRVIGLAVGYIGALAERAVMDARLAFPAPPELTDAEASSLFSAYQTGWFALHRRAGIQPGETLLVHAATGGVGMAAVQLGRAAGARVIAVARGERKTAIALNLGADLVIDRSVTSVIDAVKEFTDGRGADVIFDPVGGDSYQESTKCVAFEGRILVIGFAGGHIQTQRLNHPLIKNYSIVGLHFGLYTERDPGLVRGVHDELSRLVASGAIKPHVGLLSPFDQAAEALQGLANGASAGRSVVLGV